MFSISAQNFNAIDDDHKEISLSKETDFKIETETDAWISLNTNLNDMKFLSHIYSYMIYNIPKLQIQKSSSKGDMTKNQIWHIVFKSSYSHKTYPFLLKI